MTRTACSRPGRAGRGARRAPPVRRVTGGPTCPGCELWLVQRDLDDPDTVRVTEMWSSRRQCDAALNLPGVGENAAQVMGLLDGPPEVADGEPTGVARMLRGSTGGAVQTGLTHYRLRSGRRQGWAHRHTVAEEIYVAVSGRGRIKVDDELFELRPLDAVRVAPASARELEAGPDGLEVLAFGSHSPGDGEMVADWWTT